MKYKTKEKYVRLICDECIEICGDGEKFLTYEEYNHQMDDFYRPWRCPDCRCYPCRFDDLYFQLPVRVEE